MVACKAASRSAEDRKHCHAFIRDPYRGPEAGRRRRWYTAEIMFLLYYLSRDIKKRKRNNFHVRHRSYWTYWSPPLASTCCSTRWAAGRTASPRGLAPGSTPRCHYRPGKHLLSASLCADSSQAARAQRHRKLCFHIVNTWRLNECGSDFSKVFWDFWLEKVRGWQKKKSQCLFFQFHMERCSFQGELFEKLQLHLVQEEYKPIKNTQWKPLKCCRATRSRTTAQH